MTTTVPFSTTSSTAVVLETVTHTIKFTGLALANFNVTLFEAVVASLLPSAESVTVLQSLDSTTVESEIKATPPTYVIVRYEIEAPANDVPAILRDLPSLITDGSLVAALASASAAPSVGERRRREDAPAATVYAGVVATTLLGPSTDRPASGYRQLEGTAYIVYPNLLSFDDVCG